MGEDIYAYNNVMFTLDEFSKLINTKTKKYVHYAAKFCLNNWSWHNCNEDDECILFFVKIRNTKRVREIVSILLQDMPVEESFYQLVEYPAVFTLFWSRILNSIDPNLPKPESIIRIYNGRMSGNEFFTDLPIILFDSDDCFTRVYSESGLALKKLLNKKEFLPINWASYSPS